MYGERRKENAIEEKPCESQSSNQNESCLMTFEKPKVNSSPCESISYFGELQEVFEELTIEYEKMNFKHKKIISKLNAENKFLMKTKIDLEKQIIY